MPISGLYGLPVQGQNLSVREDHTIVWGMIAYDSGCICGYKDIK
jgi:hypothetical protein